MSPEDRRRVATLGGRKISANREHMAEIGRRGGVSVSADREHMSELGRKGGSAPRHRPVDIGGEQPIMVGGPGQDNADS